MAWYDNAPIIDDPEGMRLIEKANQRAAVAQGREARRAGLPSNHFLGVTFRDINTIIDWQNGWRWEDEKIKDHEQKARR